MRIAAMAAAAFVLAACSSGDFDRLTSYLPIERPQSAPQSPMPEASPLAATMPAHAPSAAVAAANGDTVAAAHCKIVAKQRADDGALMGLDDKVQRQEYRGTYDDCMAWHSSHGG